MLAQNLGSVYPLTPCYIPEVQNPQLNCLNTSKLSRTLLGECRRGCQMAETTALKLVVHILVMILPSLRIQECIVFASISYQQ